MHPSPASLPLFRPHFLRQACSWLGAVVSLGLGTPGIGRAEDPPLPSVSNLKKMSLEELMDIDVTSVSRRSERLFETASAVQVITGEDVRRSGATSLPEALRLASNLEIAQIDSRQWAITARGFNNVFADKMLVMIDGRSVYTPLYAGVYWDVQDVFMEDLDQIEVISGPGGTQWGENAVNGVISINTKSAEKTRGWYVFSSAGSALRDALGVRYGGVAGHGIFYRVYLKYNDRGDSLQPSGRKGNDAWHTVQGGFRMDWETSSSTALTFQGDAYNGSMGQIGPDNIRVNGANVLGRWTHSAGTSAQDVFQFYVDHTHRRIPQSFTQDINIVDFDYHRHFPVGENHEVMWGLGYRLIDDQVENTPANAFLPANATRGLYSTFAQDTFVLSKDRLSLAWGSKLEHNYYTGFEVEPSGRLTYTPTPRTTLWAAVSRAVRTPSRVDRDLYSPAMPPYRVAGSSNVVSERLIANELGYRVKASSQLLLGLSLYYNVYDNLRSLEPINPPKAFPVSASSGLQGHSSGAETTAEWIVSSGFRLRAGYTEMRVVSEPQPGTLDRATRASITRDPNHQASLRLQATPAADWEFDGTFRYVSHLNNPDVPGYGEADLHVAWHLTSAWDLSLLGANLLHKQHAEFNSAGSRREIQRSVNLQAAWRY